MKSHFAMMARYNAWANARLYAEARTVSDESYRKDVGAQPARYAKSPSCNRSDLDAQIHW